MKELEKGGRWRAELVGYYVESVALLEGMDCSPSFLGIKILSEKRGEAKIYPGHKFYPILFDSEKLHGKKIFLNFTYSPKTILGVFNGENDICIEGYPPTIRESYLIVEGIVDNILPGNPTKLYLILGKEWVDEDNLRPLSRATGLLVESLIELSRIGIGDKKERLKAYSFFLERLGKVTADSKIFEGLSEAERRARENDRLN
uniref:DUF447 family protein n=1 Tax=Fervidicoccus fontis TaxID=683846 RepID=A0A7J3SLJ2_9CREN